MTGVMLGQSTVPILLFTTHGHARPIDENGCRGWDPVAPCLARGLHDLSSEAEVCQEGRALPCLRCRGWTLWWRYGARTRRKLSPEAPISPETFPQGSGGTEAGFRSRATDTLSAPLAGRFCRGPYNGALVDVQGVVVRHPLGTLVYWYPTVLHSCLNWLNLTEKWITKFVYASNKVLFYS
jgi:hypothetical protein